MGEKFENQLKENLIPINQPNLPIASLVTTLQLANRKSDRDRFHSTLIFPSKPLLNQFAKFVSKSCGDIVTVDGGCANFESLIGYVDNGNLVRGTLFDPNISAVVIKYPESLSPRTKQAVQRLMSSDSYVIAKDGVRKKLSTQSTIISASNSINEDFESGKNLLDQIDVPPKIIRAADMFVVDSPHFELSKPCDPLAHKRLQPNQQNTRCIPTGEEPSIPKSVQAELLTSVEAHSETGRFASDWPTSRNGGLLHPRKIKRTLLCLSSAYARCMGDCQVDPDKHAIPARTLMDLIIERIENPYADRQEIKRHLN